MRLRRSKFVGDLVTSLPSYPVVSCTIPLVYRSRVLLLQRVVRKRSLPAQWALLTSLLLVGPRLSRGSLLRSRTCVDIHYATQHPAVGTVSCSVSLPCRRRVRGVLTSLVHNRTYATGRIAAILRGFDATS